MKAIDKLAYAAIAVLVSMTGYFIARHVLDERRAKEKAQGDPNAQAAG